MADSTTEDLEEALRKLMDVLQKAATNAQHVNTDQGVKDLLRNLVVDLGRVIPPEP